MERSPPKLLSAAVLMVLAPAGSPLCLQGRLAAGRHSSHAQELPTGPRAGRAPRACSERASPGDSVNEKKGEAGTHLPRPFPPEGQGPCQGWGCLEQSRGLRASHAEAAAGPWPWMRVHIHVRSPSTRETRPRFTARGLFPRGHAGAGTSRSPVS